MVDLDLPNVILLDGQSTIDLWHNKALVENISMSKKTMTLASNGGSMKITHQATAEGYHRKVWFNTRAITNIVSLISLINQCCVTYNNKDKSFVVHREEHNKPNMTFKMHQSRLHHYKPHKSNDCIFVNTMTGNKEGFSW